MTTHHTASRPLSPVPFIALAGAAGLVACGGGGGAKTPQELGEKVLAAIQAKDFGKLEPLLLTPDLMKKSCPDMPEKDAARATEKFEKHKADMKANFDKCAAIDWTNAKIVETNGGEDKRPIKECTDATKVKDLKLVVEVGGKKLKIKIDDPIRAGGMLYLVDDVTCDSPGGLCADVADNVLKIAATSSDEALKKMASDPSALSMLKEACETKQAGNREMFECIVAAKTDTDLKACDKQGKKDEAKAATADGELPPACKDFTDKYAACIDKMPEAARASAKDGLKQMQDAWSKVPKEALADACKTALDSAKGAFDAACPGVFGGAAEKPAEPGGAVAPGAAGATGAPSCDAYLKGMEACMAKMPEAGQAAVRDGLKQTKDAWNSITDKTALEGACKSALDAAKQAMTSMCPDVKWE